MQSRYRSLDLLVAEQRIALVVQVAVRLVQDSSRIRVLLQNYVGSQIAMFANGLAHRLGQHGYHIPTDVYKESAREVFQLLISDPSPRRMPQRTQDLQLVFRHDCLCDP